MATKKTTAESKRGINTLSDRNKLLAIRERLILLKSDIDPHIMGRFKEKPVLSALREIKGKVADAVKQIDGYLKEMPRDAEERGSDEAGKTIK